MPERYGIAPALVLPGSRANSRPGSLDHEIVEQRKTALIQVRKFLTIDLLQTTINQVQGRVRRIVESGFDLRSVDCRLQNYASVNQPATKPIFGGARARFGSITQVVTVSLTQAVTNIVGRHGDGLR